MRQVLLSVGYVCIQTISASTVVLLLCGRLSAAVIFESALTTEPQPGLQIGIGMGGSPSNQIYGAAFAIPHTVQVEAIGGFFFGVPAPNNDDLFGAIIRLPSIDGLPSGDPLNFSEVMAHAVFHVDRGLAHEVIVPLAVTLQPGAYAVVFGNGLFGTEGAAGAPSAGPGLNARYLVWNTSIPGWRSDEGNYRFFVLGSVPEPSAALLASTVVPLWSLAFGTGLRRRKPAA